MNGQERFKRLLERYPHPRKPFFERPHLTRRHFFQIAGAGLTGSFLAGVSRAQTIWQASVTTQNKARNVIFILLAGAPSHTDTFDLKVVNGVTPAQAAPETISGLLWPTGVLPKLGGQLGDIAVVRSMRAWALVHSLAQTWAQIGRNPTSVLGDIAPNIGSVVALEKEKERSPGQVFPTFLALNSNGAAGAGYFPSAYAPFRVIPATGGLRNTTHADGAARIEDRWNLLHALDGSLRVNSPLGRPPEDINGFYAAAKGMMYSPVVDQAFRFTNDMTDLYGRTGFGNACLVAKQVLAANQGTRFIQITFGGWDMHGDIYGAQNPNGNNIFRLGKQLDDGLSALLGELKASGLLDETLVVMMGEFGRTVGALSAAGGRDHFLQQFCLFAGAGVKGGRAIGSTDERGASTVESGWSRQRDIRTEDVEATIYSALGIDWTTIRYDDPFKRGFEYVPQSKEDLYGPINELWS